MERASYKPFPSPSLPCQPPLLQAESTGRLPARWPLCSRTCPSPQECRLPPLLHCSALPSAPRCRCCRGPSGAVPGPGVRRRRAVGGGIRAPRDVGCQPGAAAEPGGGGASANGCCSFAASLRDPVADCRLNYSPVR